MGQGEGIGDRESENSTRSNGYRSSPEKSRGVLEGPCLQDVHGSAKKVNIIIRGGKKEGRGGIPSEETRGTSDDEGIDICLSQRFVQISVSKKKKETAVRKRRREKREEEREATADALA